VECSNISKLRPLLQNFSQTIGQLPNLKSLNLLNTPFLYAESLGKGFKNSYSLEVVDLENCWFSFCSTPANNFWQGGSQLFEGLQFHHNLTHLDLQNNFIGLNVNVTNDLGEPDPNSTKALAKALQSWPQLQSLNLADNYIGFENKTSASYFLNKLSELATTVYKNNRTLQVNLVNWHSILTPYWHGILTPCEPIKFSDYATFSVSPFLLLCV